MRTVSAKALYVRLLSTLLRFQRDHHLHEITQGVATLYPGLCAFALCLSFAFPFSRRPLVQPATFGSARQLLT